MPIWDQLEIIKPNGEFEFRSLDPNNGIVNIGSDPQNDVVIAAPGINPFHAFLDYRRKPARFVLLHPSVPETDHTPQVAANPMTLELAGHILIFFDSSETSKSSAAPGQSFRTITSLPSPNDQAIRAELSSQEWRIDVGDTASPTVTVTNSGHIKADFVIDVVDLDPNWFTVSTPSIALDPGAQHLFTLSIRPPRQAGSRAGSHPFTVRVSSSHYPGQEKLQQATLIINPYDDFDVSALSPKRQSVSWSKSSAQYLLSLTNKSNTSTLFHLEGSDDESACSFEFRLPGESIGLTGQVELTLAPDERISIPIQVAPLSNPLVGFGKRLHRFTIAVSMPHSDQMSRSLLGELARKPLVGLGMMAMLALGLALMVLFVGNSVDDDISADLPLIALTRPDSSDRPGMFPFSYPPLATATAIAAEAAPPFPDDAAKQLTYEAMFQEIGPRYGLDWQVLEALAYRESRMNYLAVGRSNDMGLMQVIPSTWNEWAPKVEAYDPFDPYNNILVGASYLAYVRDFCIARGHAEAQWMLVAYNWGPSRLERFWQDGGTWIDVPVTQRNYAASILEMAANRALDPATVDEIYAAAVVNR